MDSLLLDTSSNFPNSYIIDDIHQSMIDINGEEDEESVKSLLINAINNYLCIVLKPELAIELFSLIPTCFLRFPTRFLNILSDLLKKSKINSNYIIVTSSVLSCMSRVEPKLSLPDFFPFVREALNEILDQITNSGEKTFTVFNHKIDPRFQHDLVIDLLLSSELTTDLLTKFLPYVCSQIIYTKNPKFARLVHEITKNGFISLLDPSIITDTDLFSKLSSEDLAYFLPLLDDQIFTQIFPEFERTFCEGTNLNSSFIINLLNKCDKLNLKLKQIEKIFNFLKPSDFTSHVIDQLKKYDFVIPNEYGVYFTDDVINISSDTFVHLKPLTEKSKETFEFDELSISSMKHLFEEGKSNEIIEKVIFSNYPPSNENVTFLLNFIKLLIPSQLELFYSIEQNRPILLKILEKKIFPSPSLLNIIDVKTVIDVFQTDKNDQNYLLLLYSYAFCRGENEKPLDKVTVVQPKNDNLLNFIENNEIEKLVELDNDSLLLAVSALILADKKVKNVCGLTKECVLQFFAIALNNNKDKNSIAHLITSPEIEETLKEGCILLKNSESKILNASINSILSKLTENELFVKSDFSLKIINILIDLLIKDEYRADKMNFYKLLFNIINGIPEKLQINNKIELIHKIIKDMNAISKFSNEIKLNLSIFQSEEITDLILHTIQNDSSTKDEVINTINLIQNYVTNLPTLKFDSFEKVQKISEEIIKAKNWDELFIVCNFLVSNNFIKEFRQILNNQIPSDLLNRFYSLIPNEERTADEFISLILSTPGIELKDSLFESLFKKLTSIESVTIEYLKIILNRFRSDGLKTEDLLKYTINEYNKYGDLYIKAFDIIRVLNPSSKLFIRRHDYKYITFSNPEFVNELISKLFTIITEEPDKYQAFFCLKQIASTFPFFFDSNPIQVFNSVLPAFNNYSLIYDENYDELTLNKIKSSITAISFIISAIHSTTVIDSFGDWIFQNIKDFTHSQIICFIYIMKSILKTENTKFLFMNFIEKYFDVIEYFLKRDDDFLKEGPLSENYYFALYDLIIDIYCFKSMDTYDWLVKDELKKKDRPFYYFNKYHSTIYFTLIKDFEINCKNEVIIKYKNDITKDRPFWLHFYPTIDEVLVRKPQVEDFMNHYKQIVELEEPFDELEILSYKYTKTEKMIRYGINQDMWIYEYFFRFCEHSLLPRYQQIIKAAKFEIDYIAEKAKFSHYVRDKKYFDIEKDSFTGFYTNNTSLFKIICEKILTLKVDKNQTKFYSMISCISESDEFIKIAFEYFTKLLENIEKENNNGSITLTNFIVCLKSLRKISKLSKSKEKFDQLMGIKLFNMALQPQYRTNDNFLLELSQLLSIFDKNDLVPKVTHIIGFMFLSKNKEVIRKAILLCSKFDQKKLSHLGIIQDVFDRELSIENFTPSILIDFCNFYPICFKARNLETLNFVKELFVKYENKANSQKYKNELGELIISLMNILSPDRNSFNSFSMSDSSTMEITVGKQKFSFQPIPSSLWESNPKFWNLFIDNRSSIYEIIQKQQEIVSSFKLFTDFPEFFDFKLRMKYFRDKMASRIDVSETNYLNINRKDILKSSYYQVQSNIYYKYISEDDNDDDDEDEDDDSDSDFDSSQSDDSDSNRSDEENENDRLLNEFDITFDDEEGVDAGGLTRDWFTNLLKAIFDPKNNLFVPNDKGFCYQPKSKSKSEKKLKYFKFAGKIIARAIVEGICIETHLSLPFIKQILHRKVCFKDLQNYDVSLYNSFQSILDTDIDHDPYNEYYFEATKVDSNGMKTVPLKRFGRNLRVYNFSKNEFVELIAKYYLADSIKKQIKAFSKGFDSIIPHKEIRIFTASEFELLVCGVPEINVDDLKKNFIYEDGYTENSPPVVLFFEAISKWSQENLAKLLLFFTATSIVPADGVTKDKLVIGKGGGRENYPVAHTCSNKIDLPSYETEEELNEKFMLAINIEYFDRA